MPEKLISSKGQIKRMPTNIIGLDEHMEGGVPRGSTILVTGTAGSMKSSISFNALYREAELGNNVLYITLEQSYISLLNQMINMGYDFNKIDVTIIGSDASIIKKKIKQINSSKHGHIILSDLGSLRAAGKAKDTQGANYWDSIKHILETLKKETNISAIVIDSINALYVLSDFKSPRNKVFEIFAHLRDLEVTSFIVSEMPKDARKYTQFEIEDYLADGVMVIQLVERNRKNTREIHVPKMRATNVNTDIFTLQYGKHGFEALYGGKMPIL